MVQPSIIAWIYEHISCCFACFAPLISFCQWRNLNIFFPDCDRLSVRSVVRKCALWQSARHRQGANAPYLTGTVGKVGAALARTPEMDFHCLATCALP